MGQIPGCQPRPPCLAQLILRQKEMPEYKENPHPRATFVSPHQERRAPLLSHEGLNTPSSGTQTALAPVAPINCNLAPLTLPPCPHSHSGPYSTLGDLPQPHHFPSTLEGLRTNHAAPSALLHNNFPPGPLYYAYSPKKPGVPSHADTQVQLAWLGYHQELRRDWDFWSSLSLSTLNIGTIPGSFLGVLTASQWGGPCVLFWGYFLGMIVLLCLSAVVAEIASAYPVAGAMLTWTFKLARANPKLRDWARYISWLVGTTLFVAHVVIQVALTSQCTLTLMDLLGQLSPTWVVQPGWQTFLLNTGHLCICGLLLCTAPIRSPRLWKALGGLSLGLFIVICASLFVGARAAGSGVGAGHLGRNILKFENQTDFGGLGADIFVFLMGSSLISLAFGAEASAHLAEETKNPAATVPTALFTSTLVSYLLGLILNICLTATILPLSSKASDKAPQQIGIMLAHCTPSVATTITICVLLLMVFQDIAQLFAASRFTWAMARDNAFPGSQIWRRVSGPKVCAQGNSDQASTRYQRIPRMAIALLVGCGVVTAAALELKESIVSDSLITSATYLLVICYLAPLTIYLSCDKDVLDYDGRNVWRIRGLSRPCAWISVISLTFVLILMACPRGFPITTYNWSWSLLITILLALVSTFTWITYGSSRYIGPIKSITFWTTGQEVDFHQLGHLYHHKRLMEEEEDQTARTAGVFQNKAEVDEERCMDQSGSRDRTAWPIRVITTTVTEICAPSSFVCATVDQ